MVSLTVFMFVVSICVHKVDCVFASYRLPPNESEEDLKQLFIMDFKRRLMEKLHMKTEPKSAGNLPTAIMEAIASHDQAAGDEPRRTVVDENKIKDIVLTPFRTEYKFQKKTISCKFKVAYKKKSSYEVTGVKLWLHKKKNLVSKSHWFQIYEKVRDKRRLLVNETVKSFTSEWKDIKFEPHKSWKRTPWKTLIIEIDGIRDRFNRKILSTGTNQPLLQLKTRPVKKRLHKRSQDSDPDPNDCNNNGNCCKHTMTLNLKRQIPWVVIPKHIQARVCLGKCPVLHRTRWTWSVLAQIQKNRQPCCVPTKLSPTSVIYTDDNGNFVHSTFQNMLVDSCGCS